jgi:hypothetical protein
MPRRRSVAVAMAATTLFAAWAFLKPPLQSPDEGAHFARALGVPTHPWIVPGEAVTIGPAVATPFAGAVPPTPLNALFFQRQNHLSAAGVDALKALPWPEAAGHAAPVERRTSAWSYPAPYYVAVFAVGQAATEACGLSPYASVFAYRLASVGLAALLWAWAWRRLGQCEGLRRWRVPIALVVTLNPMLALVTSSVNPDAVFAPLGALAILAVHEAAGAGTRMRSAFAIVLAALLAKPAGLLLALALIGLLVSLRLLPWWRPAFTWRAVTIVAGAMAVAIALHYAWSVTRTYGQLDPAARSVSGTVVWLGWAWKSYWGLPGYLDYWLPRPWYIALTLLWAANLALAWWRLRERSAATAAQAFVMGAACGFAAAIVAGALLSVPGLSYNVQGRYLFPVGVGIAAVVVHGHQPMRWSFILFLAAFHVALAHESVLRYFGDYGVLVRSLPWR